MNKFTTKTLVKSFDLTESANQYFWNILYILIKCYDVLCICIILTVPVLNLDKTAAVTTATTTTIRLRHFLLIDTTTCSL